MTSLTETTAASVPAELRPLISLVRRYLTRDLLNSEWYEAAEERERTGEVVPPTFGHCAAAAGAFWELAGGSANGWKFRRITKKDWPEGGPHYFVEHVPTKTRVDPTADQFSIKIPYDKAEGGAPPTRGGSVNKSARELSERVLGDPAAEEAVLTAKEWSIAGLPDAVAAAQTTVVRAAVEYTESPSHTVFRNLTDATHRRILGFLGQQGVAALDIWDDAISVSYKDAPAVMQFLRVAGVPLNGTSTMHAENAALALFVRPDNRVEASTDDDRKPQGQREIDKTIRKFLTTIKARDIRIRRIGHVNYTWLHPIDVEPDDTGSDLRWELKQSGGSILMGVYDIKPFYRIVPAPFDVKKLKEARDGILKDMDADAGGS